MIAMTTNKTSQTAVTVSVSMGNLLFCRAAREAKRLGSIVPPMIFRDNSNTAYNLRER